MASVEEKFSPEKDDQSSDEYEYADDSPYNSDDDNNTTSDDDNNELDMPDVDSITITDGQYYSVLDKSEIQRRQEEEISLVSSTIFLPKSSSAVLLSHYHWYSHDATAAWFDNEEKVRTDTGLLEPQPSEYGESVCGICYDDQPFEKMRTAGCGHYYCTECWAGYIGTSIQGGPGCLTLRCPECRAAVDQDMVNELASDEEQAKYSNYLVRSYVEGMKRKRIKWCPSPGCEYAIEFPDGSAAHYDVECLCSFRFCWGCGEDAHRPFKCDIVAKWVEKNQSDGETTKWMVANSKPCPKCKRAIEKNEGCMHIYCTPPCLYEFCWLCLGAWTEHNIRTGGSYVCNKYEEDKRIGIYNEEERRKQNAKRSIFKYTHYYERWSANHNSMLKALENLNGLKDEGLEEFMGRLQCEEQAKVHVKFVMDAWAQIAECRRVLKWSYTYGYFLPEHEKAKKTLFEDLQGQAESALERLHNCLEKELKNYLAEVEDYVRPSFVPPFADFKNKVTDLTTLNARYFENLIRALDNGLQEVICQNAENGESSDGEGTSKRVTRDQRWHCLKCETANPKKSRRCIGCKAQKGEF